MKIAKLFFEIFSIHILGYSILLTVAHIWIRWTKDDIVILASMVLIFSIIWSALLLYINVRNVRNLQFKNYQNNLYAQHLARFYLKETKISVFQDCLDSVKSLGEYFKVEEENIDEGSISISIANRCAITDKIMYNIVDKGNGKIEISISCKPGNRMEFLDFGRNLKNLTRLVDYFKTVHDIEVKIN
jgi:hypothetical protein